jgi:hypothetical protein
VLTEAAAVIKNVVCWSEKPRKQVGRFKGKEYDSHFVVACSFALRETVIIARCDVIAAEQQSGGS